MRRMVSLGVRLLWLVACLSCCAWAEPPFLTNIASVRDLTPANAAKGLPVRLRATITYNNSLERTMFIQDSTGFLYVLPDRPYAFSAGTLVEIAGKTSSSYTTQVESTDVREISAGTLPQPPLVDYKAAARHDNDCRYVSMRGIIRAASFQRTGESRLYLLQLEVDGNMIDVVVSEYRDFHPDQLLDATVEVMGVLGGRFDSTDQIVGLQINVSNSDSVKILAPGDRDPSHIRLTPLGELFRSDLGLMEKSRLRTRGVVTLYDAGEKLVIMDGNSNLLARTRQMDPLEIGQQIEVTGFPSAIDGSAGVELAQFSPSGGVSPLSPRDISFAEAMSGKYENGLVSLEGEVVSGTHESHLDTLILRSGDRMFQAVFRKNLGDPDPIPSYQTGTRLRVTGVCLVHVRGFWGAVESFQIHLRSAQDLTVIAMPSWWTVKHLLLVISGLLGIVFVAFIWGLLMRRRLASQEELLRRNIQSEAARLATLARLERQRSYILELINSFEPLRSVVSAIHIHTDEMWPGTFSYAHMLQNRKLILIAHSRLSAQDIERLKIVDPANSPEACANAIRTRSLMELSQIRTAWSRPLISSNGEILGTMTFESEDDQKVVMNQDAFDFGCHLAAIAIDNRRLYEGVLHRSQHDQLTGLANRALIDVRIEEALDRGRETQCLAGVLFLDLDDFKAVNDNHSHRVGDLYLCEVARRFEACLRSCDTLGRVGGDEFIIVIGDLLSPDEPRVVAQRLVKSMKSPIIVEGFALHGSVSVGLAIFPEDGESLHELKHQADAAMYAAKRAGGNQVRFSSSLTLMQP